MAERRKLELAEWAEVTCRKLRQGGLLLTSVSADGKPNAMTIGWGLLGWFYHGNPMWVVAVAPARYTFKLLDEVAEFVVAVPSDAIAEAVAFCGKESGRNMDKFKATGLTPIPSVHVKPPSIKECVANFECRIYHKQRPPHLILTPEHRQRPLAQQHTIYFAEVLGVYAGG